MKILIADDDVVSLRRLEAFLVSWDYEVVVASDGDEAWHELMEEDAPRLAILDWMMPGKDGPAICEEARKLKGDAYIYILLLTAKDRKENIIQGLEAGADDYLTKPYDAHELRARLRAGRRILALQEALLSARDALRFQASLDPLTGLWNRTAILGALKRELVRAERQDVPVAVLMIDLDHFSRINETHGHLVGDTVLREAAQRIRNVSRLYDAVGRYGGEEFVIIAPGCKDEEARAQGERIRAALGSEPMDLSDGIVRLTASLGVVSDNGNLDLDSNSLVLAADAALVRAKELGRNRVELASSEDVQAIAGKQVPTLRQRAPGAARVADRLARNQRAS